MVVIMVMIVIKVVRGWIKPRGAIVCMYVYINIYRVILLSLEFSVKAVSDSLRVGRFWSKSFSLGIPQKGRAIGR